MLIFISQYPIMSYFIRSPWKIQILENLSNYSTFKITLIVFYYPNTYHVPFHFPVDKAINNIPITIYLSDAKDILKSSFTNIIIILIFLFLCEDHMIIIYNFYNNKMFLENSTFKNKIFFQIRIPI